MGSRFLPAFGVMAAVVEAMVMGRGGDAAERRARLIALWERVGATGDPLHRCTICHCLADLCDGRRRGVDVGRPCHGRGQRADR